MPQSAAAPSPFTPIADYAFLSDCHTGALVAPDGTIDWLCIPRFDSPSVFGSLLDRGAGAFRLGPFGTNVPSSRHYEPGTNTLVTTWKTPSGWATVHDALTMGPRRGEDTITPHTRPPTDEDADHVLVADGQVHRRQRRDRAGVRAGVRLRPGARRLDADAGSPPRRRERRRSDDAASDRHAARNRGEPRPRPPRAARRRRAVLRPFVGRAGADADHRRGGQCPARGHDAVLAPLAVPGPHPRSRVPCADPALRARDQGADIHADGRDRRRADHLAARDPGRRAQLGLPLHVDPRLDVHAPGPALPRPGLGGRRVHAVHRRPRAKRRRRPADHVRDRRSP